MCRCQPQMRTPWCPNCCTHDGSKHFIEDWPTGEAVEVCELCGMSRACWEQGESEWQVVDLVEARKEAEVLERQVQERIKGPSVISYQCECGGSMVVSVEKVSRKLHEFRMCDRCGEDVPWDEFTIG